MKTRYITLIAGILFIIATVASPVEGAEKFKLDPPLGVTVAAGSIGGGWFIYSTSFFNLFEDYIDGLKYSIVPGGGVANAIAVNEKQALFGMNFLDNLASAYQGREPFKKEMLNLRGIFNMNYLSSMHCIVLKKLGVNSLSEIKEKKVPIRIDTGPRGTGGELAAGRVLELHGCGYENIKSWGGKVTFSSYRDAINRMMDGHIDAFMNTINVGNPLAIEITNSRDVVILPMEEEPTKILNEKYGYPLMIIPAGSYKGLDKDVPVIAQATVLTCHKDAPDDLVYEMTKLIMTNKERLAASHKAFSAMTPETAAKDFPVPLHPGAERYYKEIGVIK